MINLEQFANENRYFIAAHRGASAIAPENTLTAYKLAIEGGAQMVEIDVQTTLDGEIIAYHDFSIEKLTGTPLSTSDLTLAELKNFDAGEWFDEKYKGEKIPTLGEILELIKGKAYTIIELKSEGKEIDIESLQRLYDTIKSYNYLDKTLFASFDYRLLIEIKKIDSSVYTAAIKLPDDPRLPSELKEKYGISAYVLALDEINDTISQNAEENNVYLGAYSTDTLEQLEYVLKFNVKAIVSNNPAHIKDLMNNKKM